ncbi:MAG: Mu-like prophage major head subunit gpT family protein [Acidobacteriota bacterium]
MSSSAITNLQRLVQSRNLRLLGLDGYDRQEVNIESLIAAGIVHYIDSTTGPRPNPLQLEDFFVFPQVFSWDEQVAVFAQLNALKWDVAMRGWSSYIAIDEVNADREQTVLRLANAMPQIGAELRRDELQRTIELLNSNPTAYDGQDFFDTDHEHPDGQSYSNAIQITEAITDSVASPSSSDVRRLLQSARHRLHHNTHFRSRTTRIVGRSQLTIYVYDEEYLKAFQTVLVEEELETPTGRIKNSDRGTFDLFYSPIYPGPARKVHVFARNSGFPAVFFVRDRNPWPDTWTGDQVPSGMIATGLKSIYGIRVGLPQGAVEYDDYQGG